ncbi:hypothetical protein [Sphingomonas hengshuiensis]|uniref:Uncharacterized protein n=1 Tax=Sphingomonas hengshuiensis TaxID=1609977 RepID=A0A7U5BED4_9SPHN|nr:hypothetical protein [Sphingomonas hengshuiensis]AJP70701.1 hypothetical protein TS85_00980 [Sphingomonas hengshuiensis]
MIDRSPIPEPVQELLWEEYCAAIRYQRQRNDITVAMTFDEFLSLWPRYQLAAITDNLAKGPAAIRAYMSHRYLRPVCSWVAPTDLVRGGVMTVRNAKIRPAKESKHLFGFRRGSQHSPAAKIAIGDSKRGRKQTPQQIADRTAARLATMAAKRAMREAAESGQS